MNSNLSDIAQALTQSVAADGQTPITGSGISFPPGSPSSPGVTFQADNTTGMYYPGSQQLGFAAGGQSAMVLNAGAIGSPSLGPVITIINGAVINPVGIVMDFAGAGAGTGPPPGWFYCNGQTLSRTAYPELYDTIGIGYGPGNGSTTFNLPDLRGRVVAGLDNMGGTAAGRITSIPQFTGASGGEEFHALTVTELASHGHSTSVTDPGHTHGVSGGTLGGTAPQGVTTGATGVVGTPTSITINSATTGISVGVNNTGTGSGHNNLQPMSMFAKIIFAGRV